MKQKTEITFIHQWRGQHFSDCPLGRTTLLQFGAHVKEETMQNETRGRVQGGVGGWRGHSHSPFGRVAALVVRRPFGQQQRRGITLTHSKGIEHTKWWGNASVPVHVPVSTQHSHRVGERVGYYSVVIVSLM